MPRCRERPAHSSFSTLHLPTAHSILPPLRCSVSAFRPPKMVLAQRHLGHSGLGLGSQQAHSMLFSLSVSAAPHTACIASNAGSLRPAAARLLGCPAHPRLFICVLFLVQVDESPLAQREHRAALQAQLELLDSSLAPLLQPRGPFSRKVSMFGGGLVACSSQGRKRPADARLHLLPRPGPAFWPRPAV